MVGGKRKTSSSPLNNEDLGRGGREEDLLFRKEKKLDPIPFALSIKGKRGSGKWRPPTEGEPFALFF